MKNKKTILITGSEGQLGSEIREAAASLSDYKFIFTDRAELDITDDKAVKDFFSANHIDICVNCAAYTAVDKAEQERELAEKINANAVGYLAKACREHNAFFIHISTDYVFNGKATKPYQPEAATDPVNFYGETKLRGEQLAFRENENSMVIRTAWVYSSYGSNFVKTMLRLMKEKESLNVVSDQKGTPTYAADLAAVILKLIAGEIQPPGIYHYTNAGETDWCSFAREIARLSHANCKVDPIPASQYPTPAARPAYSVLDKTKIMALGIRIPEWKDSLEKCIARLV